MAKKSVPNMLMAMMAARSKNAGTPTPTVNNQTTKKKPATKKKPTANCSKKGC